MITYFIVIYSDSSLLNFVSLPETVETENSLFGFLFLGALALLGSIFRGMLLFVGTFFQVIY